MDQAQQQLLEKTLRRFHAGLKTFQLYSPSHASAQATVQDVTASLRGYLQRYGAVALQVTRDKLLIDGLALSDGSMNSLAFFLYIRNLASLGILPGVADHEVAALLNLLSQDRQTIEGSGGVEQLASRQDLPRIIVKAITLQESGDVLSEAGLVDALTRTRRLSPEQRELVFSVLRSGAADTAALLGSVQTAAGGTAAEGREIDVEPLLVALETLDRAILDEPVEEQEALLQALAQGVLQLDERVRAVLAPELLMGAVEGGSGRALLNELTGQDIALLMLGPAGHSEVATSLVRFLADLRLPDDKTAEVSAFLQTALAAGSAKLGSLLAPAPGAHGDSDGSERDVWSAVDPSLLTFGPDDETALDVLRHEASEGAVTRDAVKALINLLRLQERPEEIAETATTLAAHLEFLMDRQEFDLLELALQVVQEARSRADAARLTIDAALARVLTTGVLDRLVDAALRVSADAPGAVLHGLVAICDQAVPHLIRALEREPDGTQRLRLCALLVDICAGRADLIGAHLPAASWQLTRNLALILGELRDPAAATHLARLAGYPEYRVRREAIDALRKLSSPQARAALTAFLNDPDPRIQFSLIEGADTPPDTRLVEWMQQAVRSPDWTLGTVAVKVAAIKALVRMQAEEALPLLRRLAGARLVFGQGKKTVRDAARQAMKTWERNRRRPA